MSRAFIKEDSAAPEEPVKRQASGLTNYVTAAGLEALKARLQELKLLRAKLQAGQKTEDARGLELCQAELDISYFDGRVKSARLVDNRGSALPDVRFGALVTVRGTDGRVKEYSIVGEDEADAAAGRLNWASPLAAALMGKKAGEKAVLHRAGASVELEIISVKYPAA